MAASPPQSRHMSFVKNAPSHGGCGLPSNRCCWSPVRKSALPTNGISNGFICFCTARPCVQHTDHATCDVCKKGRIYAMRPKKWSVRGCTRKAGIMADKCNRESNKAVRNRRLRPLCCRLWRCFKHTSFLVAIYAGTLRASMIS